MTKPATSSTTSAGAGALPKFSLISDSSVIDSKIASLFSAVPEKHAQQPPKKVVAAARQATVSSSSSSSEDSEDESSESTSSDASSETSEKGANWRDAEPLPELSNGRDKTLAGVAEQVGDEDEEEEEVKAQSTEIRKQKRKRHQDDAIDTAEAKYFARLAKENADENVVHTSDRKRQKRLEKSEATIQATREPGNQQHDTFSEVNGDHNDAMDDEEEEEEEDYVPPQHETVANSAEYKLGADFDKATRTVFLANVSNEAVSSKSAKNTLVAHLKSFLPLLPESSPAHNLESLRFRSTAYSTPLPKRAAFARKDLMDATTKSTNAYAVFTTKVAAKEASRRLNGSVVLGRHLRVDMVEHPAKIEHHRCIFVGNLGYVDDDSQVREDEADRTGRKQQKKKHPPGDVEEGLWRTFSAIGKVENVRVVRDPKTRVGKGFGYVQFADDVAVEEALQMDGKKFPPLLPRKLRITRAKKPVKKRPEAANGRAGGRFGELKSTQYKPGGSDKSQASKSKDNTSRGRVGKLLGRAGAANMAGLSKTPKKPEDFIFEGYRASSKQGSNGLVGSAGSSARKKGGKPRTRSAKRGAAFKATGGKPKK